MSTWVECLDGFWANLAHIVTIGVHRHEQLWEVHLELPDEHSWFVHSRHDAEADAHAAAERILAAAGERCLRQGI